MTAKKGIFLSLGLLVLLVLICFGLAGTSGVQTWFVLRLANGQPGLQLQAEEIHLGFSGFSAQKLHLVKDGLVVDVPAVEADFSTLKVITSKKLVLTRLAAHGIKVDTQSLKPALSPVGEAPSSSKKTSSTEPFSGVLNQLQLPLELTVDHVEVDGDAIIGRPAPQSALPVKFKLTGYGLAPNKEGSFNFIVTAADASPSAELSSLTLNSALKLAESDHRTLDALTANFEMETAGRLITGRSEKLKGNVDLRKAAGNAGEDYKASLAIGSARPLIDLTSHFDYSTKHLTGHWLLAATKAQLTAYLMGASVPTFEASGEGNFTLDGRSSGDASTQGDLRIKLSQLDAVSPSLASFGMLETASHFEIGYTGNTAKINKFKLSVTGTKPVLSVESLQSASIDLESRAITYEKASGDFLRVQITGVPLVWLKPFITGMELSGDDFRGELVIAPEGKGFLLKSTRPLGIDKFTLTQTGAEKPLLANATLQLDPTVNYTPTEIIAKIPAFSLRTPAGDSVALLVNVTKPSSESEATTFSVGMKATFVSLNAGLPAIGVQSTFDGSLKGNTFSVQKLESVIDDTQSHTLFNLLAAQPFSIDLQRNLITPRDAARDLLTVRFGRLPLTLAAPFLGNLSPTGEVTAGDFTIGMSGDLARFKTSTPVQISKMGLSIDGKPSLANLDLSFALDGEYSPKKLRLAAARLGVKNGAISIVDLKSSADLTLGGKDPSGTAKTTLTLNLAALSAQPIAGTSTSLSGGKMTADLEIALGATQTINGQITIDQLVSVVKGPALPSLSATLKASRTNDQHVSVEVPIVLNGTNRKSDLTLTATTTPQTGGIRFAAELKSDNVFGDDFQALAALVPGSGPATAPTAPAKPTSIAPQKPSMTGKTAKDTAPFWKGTDGEAKFSFKQIALGTYHISGFSGKLTMDPVKIEIPAVEGNLSESPFKLAGKLSFDGKQATPYTLATSVSVTKFDEGKFVKAVNPNLVPLLEGVFDVTGTFTSHGINSNDLLQKIHGEAAVSSQNGVFHAISSATIGKGADSALIGLASSFLGGGQPNEGASASIELARALFAYNYEKMTLKVTRDLDLNIQITDLNMISDSLRAEGSGQITYVENKPILEYPLALKIELFAANNLAKAFDKLNMLSTPEKNNFYPVDPVFVIKGTVGNPDRSQPTNALIKAAATEAAGGLIRKLGR